MRSSSAYYHSVPISQLRLYLMRVVDVSENASDESQQDLLHLSGKIPEGGNDIREVTLLFESLRSFNKTPSYNPAILELARKALKKLSDLDQ